MIDCPHCGGTGWCSCCGPKGSGWRRRPCERCGGRGDVMTLADWLKTAVLLTLILITLSWGGC